MNWLWETDGLSRKEYEGSKAKDGCFRALGSDFPVLMGRVVEMMKQLRYYGADNKPEGVMYELFCFQPLIVLTEILQLDTGELSREFNRCDEFEQEKTRGLEEELSGWLKGWDFRLTYCRELGLTRDLWNRTVGREKAEDPVAIKKSYYAMLEVVRRLQQNAGTYLEEIATWGKNDPAITLLYVFLQNYREVTEAFNRRWEELPSFYLERILHAGFRKPVTGKIWLTLTKNAGVADITVPAGTAFVAGKNPDGSPFCYRSVEDLTVGDLEIARVYSYLLERDPGRFPAARMGYVTKILKKEIGICNAGTPRELFGGNDSWAEPVGLFIESPLFLLREGNRNVTLAFHLTPDSVIFWRQLIAGIACGQQEEQAEIIYKILHDAFYLEISTEEGWTTVKEYVLMNEPEDGFRLIFRLNSDFPATVACRKNVHGEETDRPALKIMMNRDAWLFPYSWARQMIFDKLNIRTEVEGIASVKLYNTTGEQDISGPVYLFGTHPGKGAWLVFGNYEMALKPLTEVILSWRWLQLPDHPEGLYGYYRGYENGIDNYSFQVSMGSTVGRKWQQGALQPLFTPENGHCLLRNGPLPGRSRIIYRDMNTTPLMLEEEKRYVYGSVSGGFFRIVLEEPEMGFGHAVYRRIFAEVMMRNARSKRPLPLPVEPLSPLVEDIALEYTAEEEVCFVTGQTAGTTRLHYICPLNSAGTLEIMPDRAIALADGPADTGNLLFGFRKALGYTVIRLYVDMAALRQELDLRDNGKQAETAPEWYIRDGKRWVQLRADALWKDTTGFLTHSGILEILLPGPVRPEQLDEEGLFWLCAAFPGYTARYPAVRGFYVNAVRVESDISGMTAGGAWEAGLPAGSISSPEKNIPGIATVCQITPERGGREAGDAREMRLRLAGRISHRNRAVLPADYENLVLEHFPEVMKVKCLPGLDSKGTNRQGIVTLVVIPRPDKDLWPLATHRLLLEIEQFLQKCTDMFTVVDAVNPVYEKMTVRCRITPETGVPPGEVIRRLGKKLDGCIAPWIEQDRIPEFGYRFSLRSLQNIILEDPGVAVLQGVSVLHITSGGEQIYRLKEYGIQEDRTCMVRTSQPWCIAVPAGKHLIEVGDERMWDENAGVGKLEIGDTFVLGN